MSNRIIFDDKTNYPDVLRVSKLIFGDITARGKKCCQSSAVKAALCESTTYYLSAVFAQEQSDSQRFELEVMSLYLTLYPFSNDEDYGYQPLP